MFLKAKALVAACREEKDDSRCQLGFSVIQAGKFFASSCLFSMDYLKVSRLACQQSGVSWNRKQSPTNLNTSLKIVYITTLCNVH